MDKLAQDRGIFNRLKEKTNLTGKILESLNPEFQSMMERLRSTDEKIRAHAAEVKNNVRGAKSYTNRRDYLSAAGSMSAFHERCRWIAHELKRFIDSVDLKHYKFLLDQFDDEQKEQLFGYDPNYEIKQDDEMFAADSKVITASLKKQAGLSDWWFKATDPIEDAAHNLSSQRGIAMRALEKRFSISFLKELKANTQVMTAKTQNFLQILLTIFKRLGTALAKRNVDQYVEAAKSFISKFASYHNQFVKYYEKSIVPLKNQHEKLQEEAAKSVQPFPAPIDESVKPEEKQVEQKPKPFVPPPIPVQDRRRVEPFEIGNKNEQPFTENLRDLLSKEQQEQDKAKTAMFISRIEKFATISDAKSLMLTILAYSDEIEDTNVDASLKLLAIAEGMAADFEKDPFKDEKETPDPLA